MVRSQDGVVVRVLDGTGFHGKDVGEARAKEVGHVFGLHRERCNKGVAASKEIGALDGILKKWVKAQVRAKTG